MAVIQVVYGSRRSAGRYDLPAGESPRTNAGMHGWQAAAGSRRQVRNPAQPRKRVPGPPPR